MWTTAYLFPFIIVASASKLCAVNTTCSTAAGVTLGRSTDTAPYEPTTSPTDDNNQGTSTQCCGKLIEKMKNTSIPKVEKTDDQDKEEDDDTLNARNRRSHPGFVRFLKNLFVKPSNISDDKDIQVKNTSSTDVRTAPYNMVKDEVIREIVDGEKDKGTVYILYKLNETLEKLVKTLSLLVQNNHHDYAVVDVPLLLRAKREAGTNVSVIKLSDVTYGNVTDGIANLKSNDSNKVDNKTKSPDDEVDEHDTYSVGNVTQRTYSIGVTKFPNSGNINKQAHDSVENVTKSRRVDNVTGYQDANNNVVNIMRTSKITDNVTDKSNMSDIRKAGNTDKHTSDLIKSALKHIQKQLSEIKNLKVVSEDSFKMGYIVSSLETLELTLKKIMKKMISYRDAEWTHKLSDKIEMSKNVVSNLMKYLRLHTNLLIGNKKV